MFYLSRVVHPVSPPVKPLPRWAAAMLKTEILKRLQYIYTNTMKYISKIILCALFLLTIGCQRLPDRPDGLPDLIPCTVVVSFGGDKMEGVSVVLQPKNAANNWTAGGQTDANGKAVIKTAAYYKGVVPGEYTISFKKFAPEELSLDGMALPAQTLIPLEYSTGKSKETITVSNEKSEYVFTLDALKK